MTAPEYHDEPDEDRHAHDRHYKLVAAALAITIVLFAALSITVVVLSS